MHVGYLKEVATVKQMLYKKHDFLKATDKHGVMFGHETWTDLREEFGSMCGEEWPCDYLIEEQKTVSKVSCESTVTSVRR